MKSLRHTVLEVNLDDLKHNMVKINEMVGSGVAVSPVVKANAYGHGSIGIGQTLMENGGNSLAVATLNEALELRQRYPDYRIFIMGYTPDEYLGYVVDNNLIQTIFSLDQGKILNDLGLDRGKKPLVHIKYDTGFNRMGFRNSKDSIDEIEEICKLENLEVEGIFSHLALNGREDNDSQYEIFIGVIDSLRKRGISFKYEHIVDSIAAVDYPEYRLNMIRPGAIIYGMKAFHEGQLDIRQIMTFKTKVFNVRTINKGEGVSYDFTWRAKEDTLIGTLPFGYGDGYPRNLRNKGYVIINGKKANIIGIICMDQLMVDLSGVGEVKDGDEAIIYGNGLDGSMTIDEAAVLAETNKNDILSRISMRVPRVYIKDGRPVEILNYIG